MTVARDAGALGLAAIGLSLLPFAATAIEVSSPNQKISFDIKADSDGIPIYSVRYVDESIIADARLGLKFRSGGDFELGFRLRDVARQSNDSTWEQPWGERRIIRDNYNELFAVFESAQPPRREFGVRIRVHDDGVGFRYEVPAQEPSGLLDIVEELTEFRLPDKATAFWQPGDGHIRYEHLYRTTPLANVDNAHTPITLRFRSGTHVSIHEAALVDYSAYTLDQKSPGIFATQLRPWSDGIRVHTRAPFHSPWRTLQIAPNAVGLVNSNLILNLNEPNVLADVSWVEPGKYVGIWWAMHLGQRTWSSGKKHGATTEEAIRSIDFAKQYGIDGVLVEGWNRGWDGDWVANAGFSYVESYPDFDIESVTAYARDAGVRLIGHHETGGHVSQYERQMPAGFELYESLGVRQVKTGYVSDAGKLKRIDANGSTQFEWHDGQFAINHHERVLREAAKHQISINTHEPIKDTGLRRTYPNWLSREGSRGQEFAIWGETPNPPDHTVLLAFTRLLGGPMDFTPGLFNLHPERDGETKRVQTTLAKQLALYVVLYSPIQMLPDLRENYLARPDVFKFVTDVPTDWEESVAIAGEVGDFVIIARKERDSADWYLGAISDEEARKIVVPLSFLDEDTDFIAEIYRDAHNSHWKSNPYGIQIDEEIHNDDSTLEIMLAAGGGTAIRFRPVKKAKQ